MKKSIFLLFAIIAMCLSSCSDKKDVGDMYYTYISGTYTSASNYYKLDATFNGYPVTSTNANVVFSTHDNKTADITINNIVTNNASVKLTNVQLVENKSQGGYDFSGSQTISSGTLKYSGNVVLGCLTLTLTTK
jgi:hypothetical protein